MHQVRSAIARLLGIAHRSAAERELSDELRAHLDMLIEDGLRRGLSAEEARRQALLTLGNPTLIRESFRSQAGLPWLETVWQDVRYALRMMRRAPGFTLIAVLSLALGIGANTATFTVIDALILKMLPVSEPERLAAVGTPEQNAFTFALWTETRRQQDVFSGMFAYGTTTFDLAGGGEKQPAAGLYVSGDYFDTLAVAPLLGRTFTLRDDERGAAPVAVLSYSFWQRQYGGDPSIVGRVIRLDRHPFEIVGVAPQGFFGLDVGSRFDVAVPLNTERIFHPDRPWLDGRWTWWLNVGGRLKPGILIARANARLKTLASSIWMTALPDDATAQDKANWQNRTLIALPLAHGFSDVRSQYSRALVLLMSMVAVVLLIACANLAGLLLARSTARKREIAVRMALGSSRARLVRQLLTESLMLSLIGAGVGVLIAQWTANLLIHAISSSREPVFLALSIDVRVLAFAGATAVLTGILFGLLPALLGTRVAPHEALKEAGRSLSGSRAASSLGGVLVAGQIALSLVLLISAGLLARSLYKLLTQDPGFGDRDVLLVQPDLRGLQYPPASQSAIAEDLLDRFRDIPGVRSASRSEETPISGGSSQWDVEVRAPGSPVRQLHAFANMVSPEYFETLGTPLLAGRDFSAGDNAPAPQVAILNETAAHLYFPGVNPLGQTIWQTNYWVKDRPQIPVQVIGVVKDAKYRRLRDRVPPTVYRPIAQALAGQWVGSGTYELKFGAPLADVISHVKRVSQSIDRRIGFEFHLFSTQVHDSLVRERLLAMLAGVFAGLALLLSAIGLYGLLSYVTQRRTGEIGIRMALGARRSAVIRMILRDVFLLLSVGIGLGISGSVAANRLLQSLLYGVHATDALTFTVAVLLMVLVALLASFVPARRAARVDPMATLRCE